MLAIPPYLAPLVLWLTSDKAARTRTQVGHDLHAVARRLPHRPGSHRGGRFQPSPPTACIRAGVHPQHVPGSRSRRHHLRTRALSAVVHNRILRVETPPLPHRCWVYVRSLPYRDVCNLRRNNPARFGRVLASRGPRSCTPGPVSGMRGP